MGDVLFVPGDHLRILADSGPALAGLDLVAEFGCDLGVEGFGVDDVAHLNQPGEVGTGAEPGIQAQDDGHRLGIVPVVASQLVQVCFECSAFGLQLIQSRWVAKPAARSAFCHRSGISASILCADANRRRPGCWCLLDPGRRRRLPGERSGLLEPQSGNVSSDRSLLGDLALTKLVCVLCPCSAFVAVALPVPFVAEAFFLARSSAAQTIFCNRGRDIVLRG